MSPAGAGRARGPLSGLPWLGGLLALYLALPFAALVVRLAGAPAAREPVPDLGAALWTSLATATVATAVILVLGVPLGYVLARSRGRLAHVVGFVVQLPLAVPPLVGGLMLVLLVGPYTPLGRLTGGALTDTPAGIVLAQTFVAAPFLVVAARSAFAALDPALDDLAASLGHGPLARFARVWLPGAVGGIRAGALLAWLRAFGEFGATVVLAYHPYSLPVLTYVQFGSAGLDPALVPAAVAVAAALVVLAALSRVGRRPAVVPGREEPVPQGPAGPADPAVRLDPAAGGVLAFDVAARAGGYRLTAAWTGGPGRTLVVLGPSGVGKTLLLRALLGTGTVERAAVRLGDEDLGACPAWRRGIGYVPQQPLLLGHLAVDRQIRFGAGVDEAAAAYWQTALGLDGLAGRRPQELSGGQAHRVALARALARRPRLVLLDEPFTGLDTLVRREFRGLLAGVARAVPVVLVSHDPEDAETLADDVLVLGHEPGGARGGRVVQAGSYADVLDRPATADVARLLGARTIVRARLVGPVPGESGGRRLVPDESCETWLPGLGLVAPGTLDSLAGRIVSWRPHPDGRRYVVESGGVRLPVVAGGAAAPGDAVGLAFDAGAVRSWEG